MIGNCILCVYSKASSNQGFSRDIHKLKDGTIRKATRSVYMNNGNREVCENHYTIIMTLELTEEQKTKTVVFLKRKDNLFDMIFHPRGLLKFGLSRRERDAYATAQPKYDIKEVQE